MIALDTRCKRSDSIVHRRIGTEAVLVPIRGDVADLESIYTLNGVGQRVWELLDGEKTVAAIREAIVQEFDVDADTAGKDLLEFLKELLAVKAIELQD